jgi:hypothetical protein
MLPMIVVATLFNRTDPWLFLIATAAFSRFVPPNEASQ